MTLQRSLQPTEREALLAEVRSHLPAFLHRGASEQADPAGDVRALLSLEQGDLDRVLAVHGCLDDAVLAFGDALGEGLRQPFGGSVSTPVITQRVRGQIDWPRTVRHRAQVPGAAHSFAVRESGKAVDTAENRAVAWLVGELEAAVAASEVRASGERHKARDELGWSEKIERLRRQLAEAREVSWLSGIGAERPTPRVLRSLRAARLGFYAEEVAAAIDSVLRIDQPSPELLTEILSERYFRPRDDGSLFEVAVALRLARAFAERSPHPRRTRLMVGSGRDSFARYRFDEGFEVSLAYQAWPDEDESMRVALNRRHGLRRPQAARPDLIITRTDPGSDRVVLELKATHKAATIRKGLQELLGYLADRPELWNGQPAGWLVAPPSNAFSDADAELDCPLWIVSAAAVAEAAVRRFLPPVDPPS